MEGQELYIDEQWRNIVGYNGNYQVSNYGRIKRNEHILKPDYNSSGYLRVGLRKDGKTKKELIHRLVAEAFLDNPSNLPVVNHINEDKEDNRVSNLQWSSVKDNLNYGTLQERKAQSLIATNNRKKRFIY